jgi:signal transduction histidine kinase
MDEDIFLNGAASILLSNVNMLMQNLQEKTKETDRFASLRGNALENTKLELQLEKCNLKSVLDVLINLYQECYSSYSRIYELQYMASIEEFVFDKEKMIHVFNNLLSNSTNFTQDGMVLIKVINNDKVISAMVKDSGSGIKSDDLPYIFELGFRGGENYGKGAGLYEVKKIIDAHDGSIRVKSEVGRGTEVCVNLRLDLEENIK